MQNCSCKGSVAFLETHSNKNSNNFSCTDTGLRLLFLMDWYIKKWAECHSLIIFLFQKIFEAFEAEGLSVIETSTLTEEGVIQVKTEVGLSSLNFIPDEQLIFCLMNFISVKLCIVVTNFKHVLLCSLLSLSGLGCKWKIVPECKP